jgi:cobalt-zinc-cadmium efflux system protein
MCCPPSANSDERLNRAIAPQRSADKTRRLSIALALIGTFAIAEVMVGWVSHSLALMAESVHMASDCGALAVALLAAWMAQRAGGDRPITGSHRFEVWAALINGVGLLAVALWIMQEAATHLHSHGEEILSIPMLITAIVGFGVNTLNASLLHSHSHGDLNLRGAFLHMVADAASSVGVILAAIAVAFWNWTWADSFISLVVAIVILMGSVPLIYQSAMTLWEGSRNPPPTLATVQSTLKEMEGVIAVEVSAHDATADQDPPFSVTITMGAMPQGDRLRNQVREQLQKTWNFKDIPVHVVALSARPVVNLSFPSSLDRLQSSTLMRK